MDIKATIEKAVAAIVGDNSKVEAFKKDPVGTVKSVIGSAAPNDVINQVVNAVKAKLAGNSVSGAIGKIGGLFGKK